MFKLFGTIKDAVVNFFKGIWNFVTGETRRQERAKAHEEKLERINNNIMDDIRRMANTYSGQKHTDLVISKEVSLKDATKQARALKWAINTMHGDRTEANILLAESALDAFILALDEEDENNQSVFQAIRKHIEDCRPAAE